MRVVWLTDIHLNFCDDREVQSLMQSVDDARPDAILLTGDVGEAHTVTYYLSELDGAWKAPLYFVLGNHDYYYGSIRQVREEVRRLCENHPQLIYLTQAGPRELAPGIGLVGHDGWGDGRLGDYERSLVSMADYFAIAELEGHDRMSRWEILKSLGDEAAAHVRKVLPEALAKYPRVYFITHVPPLREACWHAGAISDKHWAPHFTCGAVGAALLEVMRDYPQQQLTVLCGHTHGAGETQPLPNLNILTGGAEYGSPGITKVFEI